MRERERERERERGREEIRGRGIKVNIVMHRWLYRNNDL